MYIYTPKPKPTHYLKTLDNLVRIDAILLESQLQVDSADLKKFFKEKTFSLQKTFLNYKRHCFHNLRTFYEFKLLRRKHLSAFFSNFKKKNFSELSNFFSLNILRVLHRIFPFFNFFFLKRLVARGFILLNFRKITNFFTQLMVGDFVSIFFLHDLFFLIKEHLQLQVRHVFRVKKKLFLTQRLRGLRQEKMISQHIPRSFKNFTLIYRKLPSWAEVDFLTLSFFIIKKPNFCADFFFFNPFLYRLLEYK